MRHAGRIRLFVVVFVGLAISAAAWGALRTAIGDTAVVVVAVAILLALTIIGRIRRRHVQG